MEGMEASGLLAPKGEIPTKNKKRGQKTKALEATGISGFTEALPGNEDKFGFGKDSSLPLQDVFSGHGSVNVQDGSRLLTVKDGSWCDGFSGDPVIGGLADGMASHLAFKSANPFAQSLVYNTSRFAMLEVAQLVFDGLSGAGSGNATGLAIAQLKEMVKNVLEKLDTILDEPSKSCGDFIDKALQAIEYERPKEAKGYFDEAVKNAVKGFHYVTGKGKPEAMVSIMRLMIFSEMTLATFDEEAGMFLGLQDTKVDQKRVFAIIRDNLDKLITGMKTLKNKEWFKRNKTFEARKQNALDQLLRQLLPTLVQLKTNDISKKTSTPESSFRLVITPRYVPQGLEDAAVVSKKDFSVSLWKEDNLIYVCFGGKVCDHPITTGNLESVITVDMDKLTVTIDGQKKECNSMTPALTESVLTELIENKNMQMFFHVAPYINNKMLGERLLETACVFGPANCVDFILEKSKIDADKDFYPPLHHAAANGHDDIVKLLVEKYHADVNKESYRECALSWAIRYNHISTVRTFVQLGAGNLKMGYVRVPYASFSTVTARYVGDSDNREEILRYLTHCGIKTSKTV